MHFPVSPDSFGKSIAGAWPPPEWREVHVLLAVSGGADSVALLAALAELQSQTPGDGKLHAAHFHHGLRGDQADADEALVRQLCMELAVPLAVGRASVRDLAREQGDGLEAAARHARYDFLLRTAHDIGARFVATAHTADDQTETILHHIIRGTGLAGLAGMPRSRPLDGAVTLIRPLLGVRREAVLAYLSARGLTYREDASNRDVAYTRNRLRHELLPHLREHYNPAVGDALLRLGKLATEAQQAMEQLVDAAEPYVGTWPQGLAFSCPPLRALPRYVVRELLLRHWRRQGWSEQAMGFDEWESLAEMVQSEVAPRAAHPSGAAGETTPPEAIRIFPGAIRAEKKGEQLVLTRPGTSSD